MVPLVCENKSLPERRIGFVNGFQVLQLLFKQLVHVYLHLKQLDTVLHLPFFLIYLIYLVQETAPSSLLSHSLIYLFIQLAGQYHPSPRDMRPRKTNRRTSSRPSAGLLQHRKPSTLGSALCADLGVRAPSQRNVERQSSEQNKSKANMTIYPSPLGAVLSTGSHATHSSIRTGKAPSSSVPSAITRSFLDEIGPVM
jgi:hypothetical protein